MNTPKFEIIKSETGGPRIIVKSPQHGTATHNKGIFDQEGVESVIKIINMTHDACIKALREALHEVLKTRKTK
jgi:hypothetical protein